MLQPAGQVGAQWSKEALFQAFRRFGPSGQRQEPIQALLQARGRENVSDNATASHSESLALQESSRFVVPLDLQDRESAGDEATSQVETKTTEPTAQHWAQLNVSIVHGRHVDAL
ncbi:unnamed protein product [Symbiodinium sp. CCMP2592]|nr:unnamed protein product [Symbiodinium sp. CCMP2592]